MYKNYERVVCADGFSISIQAGNGKYSVPRFEASAYTQLELGFPNRPCPFIYEYAEDKEDYTETIYPYVPSKIVDTIGSRLKNIARTFQQAILSVLAGGASPGRESR
jgi:hypothetical protein